jgi:excisionase family DNA binding protein
MKGAGVGSKQPERDVGEPMMLTYKEAAKKIGVSLSKLYQLLRVGKIRKLVLGPQVMRIAMDECESYVDRLKAEQYGPESGDGPAESPSPAGDHGERAA